MRELLNQKEFDLVDKNKCRYHIGLQGEVILTLPTGVKRQIGQLIKRVDEDENEKLAYICYRKQSVHMMRVNNSYGINEFITNTFKPDEIIINVEDTGERFFISAEAFNAKATYMHFRNQGFELQRFVEIRFLANINCEAAA